MNSITTVISTGLNKPRDIVLVGADIYIADSGSNKILKTTIGTWTISIFAGSSSGNLDGTGTSAKFNTPQGITTDGYNLFVLQTGVDTVRKITIPGAVVTTIAGSSTSGYVNSSISLNAKFKDPIGLTSDGSSVYVCDKSNHTIRKIQ